MSDRPEQVIRRYLDEQGDLAGVPVEHLLVTWRLPHLTPDACAQIERDLSRAGVRLDPPLANAGDDGEVSLTIRRPPLRRPSLNARAAPEPEPTPEPPPEPEPPRRPERKLDPAADLSALAATVYRPRMLVAFGGFAAFGALWLPWAKWSAPVVAGAPFEREVNAWGALGFEPVVISLAIILAVVALIPLDSVPEQWRVAFRALATPVALGAGVLAAIISLANALSAPESVFFADAQVKSGPVFAFFASMALMLGVWGARPREPREPVARPPRTAHGSGV